MAWQPTMFGHKVEVLIVGYRETGEKNTKGKPVRAPIITRTLFLDAPASEPKTNITKYRVTVFRRGGEFKFGVHYWPSLEREAWWEQYRQIRDGWKRGKEPNGKVEPSKNLDEILKWLKWHVKDPVAVLTELLTTPPAKKGEEDEGQDELAA